MEEIEDEIKEHFSEHQLKIEMIQIMQDELNDLSGANKPIEVKLFGPDQQRAPAPGRGGGRDAREEGQGPRHQGGQQPCLRGQPRPDGPGRRCTAADELGMQARRGRAPVARRCFQGQIATQVPESSLRITDVRVRYPDSIRFGTGRLRPPGYPLPAQSIDPVAGYEATRPASRRPGCDAACWDRRERCRCRAVATSSRSARRTSRRARTSSRPSS